MFDYHRNAVTIRGAAMGRHSDLSFDTECRCICRRVPLDSGGYDKGGAYWGLPGNLFMVEARDGEDEGKLTYVRASGKEAAMAKFPKARFPKPRKRK